MSTITWTNEPSRLSRPARASAPAAVLASAPAGVSAPARASAPARLTRRGRLVVGALLLGLAIGLAAFVTAPATATSDRGSGVVAERVTVRSGETLWGIAERVRPGVDPRATISRIRDMNALESGAVQAGQVLLVPAAR